MFRDGNAQKSIIGATPNEMHSYAKSRYLQWHNQNLSELKVWACFFWTQVSHVHQDCIYLNKDSENCKMLIF